MKGDRLALLLSLIVGFAACGCADGDDRCLARAVVTDIDETLTTSDGEWVMQMIYPDQIPEMRPDANTLMNWNADNRYAVFYVTARGDELTLADGTTALDATIAWLEAFDFPLEEGHIFLAEGLGVQGGEAVEYKSAVVSELMGDGYAFDYSYGNAESDIEAFLDAGIARDRVFLVGRLAGTMDVVDLPDEDAFTQHIEDHLPTVAAAFCE